jgi:hypothetical protein
MTVRKTVLRTSVALLALSLLASPTFATTTTLYSIADAPIDESQPSNNYGSDTGMMFRSAGNSGGWEVSPMVQFDLSSIPSGATIVSATHNLYYYSWGDNDPAGRTYRCYRITSTWDESTVTWNTQPSWSATQTSQTTCPSSALTWISWDVTSDVQDFVDGTTTNYGWIVRDLDPWSGSNIPFARLRPRESTPDPYLEIEWILQEPVPATTTWGLGVLILLTLITSAFIMKKRVLPRFS